MEPITTHKVFNRQTGRIELYGSYWDCMSYIDIAAHYDYLEIQKYYGEY